MIFNTQQLQYLIEIERTRSISQAASNLFMGQPNLSRILLDLETSLGFPVFERTRKGVRPTEKGAILLQHARNILREATFMEQLGPYCTQPNRFHICIPRSFCFMDKVTQYFNTLSTDAKIDAVIRECHPRQALELLDSGSAEIAILRYSMEYQDYFAEQAVQRKLTLIPLSTVEYQIVFHLESPLAACNGISRDLLSHYTEIMHRDIFYSSGLSNDIPQRIYSVDRMAQMQLLSQLPQTYFWSEPLPSHILSSANLCQSACSDGGVLYENVLAYKPQCAMSDIEKNFLKWIQ